MYWNSLIIGCYIVFSCFFVRFAISFECDYKPPKPEDVIDGVVLGGGYPSERHVKRAAPNKKTETTKQRPIKFVMTYDKANSDRDKMDYIKELMPLVLDYYQSVLSVDYVDGKTRLNRECKGRETTNETGVYCDTDCLETKCGDTVIPEKHLPPCYKKVDNKYQLVFPGGDGEDADYFFYVLVKDTQRCIEKNSTLAYAAHCQREESRSRPVCGYFVMCARHVTRDIRKKHSILSTIKHEMMHAMAFSSGLYSEFRDRNDNFKKFSEKMNVTVNVILTDWWTRFGNWTHDVTYLVTPAVKEAARRHFNCNELMGGELENGGEKSSTAGTHWEKRVFENEAMTGIDSYSAVMSNISLALFYDSGWYHVNLKKAEHLQWGYNRGCDFAMKSCGYWIKKHQDSGSVAPFCDTLRPRAQCSEDRTFVAKCNFQKLSKVIPKEYQYFDQLDDVPTDQLQFYGGSMELADYCPFPVGTTWKLHGGAEERDGRCLVPDNEGPPKFNVALETTGNGSRCFDHGGSKVWFLRQCEEPPQFWPSYGGGCYPFICKDRGLWFTLLNGTVLKRCYKAGHVIDIRRIYYRQLHVGLISCPACEEFCTDCEKPMAGNPGELESDLFERIPCRSSTIIQSTFVVFCVFTLSLFLS